jgi:M6 family metalloprotease-like protein
LDRLDQNGIDWSQYDIDQDGVLDAVVVLHSGYGAELKGEDCNTKRDYVSRIWSHAYANSFNSWTSADGKYRVGGYVVASAFRDRCGSEPARIGIMTHEFMHTFGLVDLYDGQEARVGRG